MTRYRKPTVNEILRKYGGKLESQIRSNDLDQGGNYSKDYLTFKQEKSPELNRYERLCKSAGGFIKLKISAKDKKKVEKHLEIAHLDVEPWQAISLGVLSFLGIFFIGLFLSIAIALLNPDGFAFPSFFFVLVLLVGVFLFQFINGYPERFANRWRLKASSQMVPAILYVVVYMRHTPNLEKAIEFASEHLDYPLAMDFKKVFYDVALGKFSSIKESLDNYLERWREYSTEFIESFHLIESSLFEPDNGRRISTLEKSLQVVLDGVYEKMLKFTHGVKAPLTNVYMLAIMLPILGIALIPLASAMLGGALKTLHIIILYNFIIPFISFFMMDKIMVLRPGGYGETNLLEKNPLYPQFKSKAPFVAAAFIAIPLILIGLTPLIFQSTGFTSTFGLQEDYTFGQMGIVMGGLGEVKVFDFKEIPGEDKLRGPFGAGALFLGLLVPLGVALFFSIAYKDKTVNLIKERKKTKQLEQEFNNSLFQLGNRLGNGVPPELVFGKVAQSSKGLVTGEFFKKVHYNISHLGMSVDKAIFDKKRGALIYFPSNLISTSMRILVEASKKGLKIAAVSLMSISEYVKNLQKITVRLKDLLAEISAEMKSNMTFLAPLLSGIVVGLALMITSILNRLDLAALAGESIEGFDVGNIVDIFQIHNMIPPYYLQIAIGLYLIQMIFILTRTLVTIDAGEDKLTSVNTIASNLKKGMIFYFVVALAATIAMFILSNSVLGGLAT
jgi:hypothetical protein